MLSQAWRSWRNAKAVALLAALALAVGIGSTTAIYTVVHAVLLKPLPYANGDRYVAFYGARHSEPLLKSSISYPDLIEFQNRIHSFDVFGWFNQGHYNLTFPGRAPRYISGIEVTPFLVDSLGVHPVLGRWFRDGAHEPSGYSTAVISHSLWIELGSDPGIVGKAITLNKRQYIVTGVVPAWFRLPVAGVEGQQVDNDVWIPLDPKDRISDRNNFTYLGYARLKPGVTLAQALADSNEVAAAVAREHPEVHENDAVKLESLRDALGQAIRPTLLLLFAAATLLLLITCANVSGLLVARSVVRARETAVRVALGAAQRQLVLQYFFEGLLVSLAGAGAGLFASFALVRFLIRLTGDYVPRSDEIGLDWTVLLFALAVAILASILSSLAPLWQALRTVPNDVLSSGVRASAGARTTRKLSQSLVIAEIALAFTLLSSGALLAAQLSHLLNVHPGFDPHQVLTFQLTTSQADASNAAQLFVTQQRVIDSLEALPGVVAAGLVNQVPLAGCCYSAYLVPEGRPFDQKSQQRVSIVAVSPGYFQTMRLPLIEGRFLNLHDNRENPVPVLVNQAAAKFYWPRGNALDSFARFSSPNGSRALVVGVVGDVRNSGLASPTVPEVYFSSALTPVNPVHYLLRSSLPLPVIAPLIRRAVLSIDPGEPVHDLQTMTEIVGQSVSLERAGSLMTTFFAAAALLMATLGVYGIISYSVRQRTVEIGTRLAVGAQNSDLFRLILTNGLKLAAIGILFGAMAVAAAVFGLIHTGVVQHVEPFSFLFSTLTVALVAALASFFPAWRASLLSPMVAIRDQPGSALESARSFVREALAARDVQQNVSEAAVSAELLTVIQRADTFSAALHLSLAALRQQLRSESAVLLEDDGSGSLLSVVSDPPEAAPESYSIPAEGFLVNRLRFYSAPLPITPSDLAAWRSWAAVNKPAASVELESIESLNPRLIAPLRNTNAIFGLLLLGAPAGRDAYSSAEKLVVHSAAGQFALMLENAHLTMRIVNQEKLRRDVALAAEVQRRLLPQRFPESSAATVTAVSIPARTVGGDYYDFIAAGDRRLGIALADVAGKGVAAALIMAVVQASLRVITAEGYIPLPQLASKMNQFVYRSTGFSSYATAFFAQLDEQTLQLRYVNAGHNPPYLLRAGTRNGSSPIEELSAGGLAIGMLPQAVFEEGSAALSSGDVLLAFTDGVTEALNPAEEEFGDDRLKDLVRRFAHLPVEEMSSRISAELKTWIEDADQYDDLTFVLMKVN